MKMSNRGLFDKLGCLYVEIGKNFGGIRYEF